MWIIEPASCETGPDTLAQYFQSLGAHVAAGILLKRVEHPKVPELSSVLYDFQISMLMTMLLLLLLMLLVLLSSTTTTTSRSSQTTTTTVATSTPQGLVVIQRVRWSTIKYHTLGHYHFTGNFVL